MWYLDYQLKNSICGCSVVSRVFIYASSKPLCGTLIINLGKNPICACYYKQIKISGYYFSSAHSPRLHLLFYGLQPKLLFCGPHLAKLLFHGPESSKLPFDGPVGSKDFLYFCIVKVSNFSIEGG